MKTTDYPEVSKSKEIGEYVDFVICTGIASSYKWRTSPLHGNDDGRIIFIRKNMTS